MDGYRPFIRSLVALASLALLTAPGVQAHPLENGRATAAAVPLSEVITGSVVGLAIDDRVNNETGQYYLLRREDGSVLPLTGPAAETLEEGTYVALEGQKNAAHFARAVDTPLSI